MSPKNPEDAATLPTEPAIEEREDVAPSQPVEGAAIPTTDEAAAAPRKRRPRRRKPVGETPVEAVSDEAVTSGELPVQVAEERPAEQAEEAKPARPAKQAERELPAAANESSSHDEEEDDEDEDYEPEGRG